MALFDDWCKNSSEEDGQKLFLKFTEKPGGRAATQAQLSETIRSLYDSLKRISDDIKKLEPVKRLHQRLQEARSSAAVRGNSRAGSISYYAFLCSTT